MKKKVCKSWLHKKWFRFVVFLVALDMAVFGIAIIAGVDILSIIHGLHPVLRVIGGGLYILVSLSIFYSIFSYTHIRKNAFLVCDHCAALLEEQSSQ